MHRRAVLASAGAALAGCPGTGGTRTARLGSIRLTNQRPRRHEVDLAVEDDGETVFSDAFQLPPADSEPTDLRVTSPVSGPGRFVVRLVTGGTAYTVETASAADCVGVYFVLTHDDGVDSGLRDGTECD
jgi:hypothetical protein